MTGKTQEARCPSRHRRITVAMPTRRHQRELEDYRQALQDMRRKVAWLAEFIEDPVRLLAHLETLVARRQIEAARVGRSEEG